MFDDDGSGHVDTSNFRKDMQKMRDSSNEKKFTDNVKPANPTPEEITGDIVVGADEKMDLESERGSQNVAMDAAVSNLMSRPIAGVGNNPVAQLAGVSPIARDFVKDFGDHFATSLRRWANAKKIYLVPDAHGTYENGGRLYKYCLTFTDPPGEIVEEIDVKFAQAASLIDPVLQVRGLKNAYFFAFTKYYGCSDEIPKKKLPYRMVREIVDSLNWLESQGFREN